MPSSIRNILLCLATCVMAGVGAGEHAGTRSVIVFNTVCARCHEGECSGRLSFGDADRVARGHILRHYPAAAGDPEIQGDLVQVLDYMNPPYSRWRLAPERTF